MATLTFDPSADGPSPEQKEAEAQALAQGEKLEEARAADEAAKWDKTDKENESAELIGGKFKSQEELLKAYQELEKLRSKENTEETSEPEETTTEEEPETPTEENPIFTKAAEEYADGGNISEESIEALSKMDSKDLIKSYVDFYSKSAQKAELQQTQVNEIKNIAGGEEGYKELTTWASQNLEKTELEQFNTIANTGNYTAIKFAVEALNSRFRNQEGYEAPMVTGKAASSNAKPYRSQAELARDIANPLYNSDPAFRSDVEERLSLSTDLL
jgi:hypothetical protein|tara:strand:- start:2077 stop:2895 length:819 start_codon:yes stop_codon:yes gene_type:complete